MKLLFVAQTMNINGANKSLLNLLSAIDTKEHQVDLFLFAHTGPLMNDIPAGVTLLKQDEQLKFFETDLITTLKKAPITIKWWRLWAAFFKKLFRRNPAEIKERIFRLASPLDTEYDFAVGYCEGSSHRFVLEKTTAHKKIGWIHIRLEDIRECTKRQVSFCNQLDHTIVVSQDSKQSAIRCGVDESKIVVIHNILPTKKILRLSTEKTPSFKKEKSVKLLTIGRLVRQKGINLILETAVVLKQRNIDFLWWIIGDGVRLSSYREKAEALGLSEYVTFLGGIDNPYPFINACDIYVQPSISEGWGMAITEAKILKKPVIASDIAVFQEQITHEKNGLITPLQPIAIADSIVRMITDDRLRESIVRHISEEDLGYEKEVNILYGLCR